MFIKSMTLTRTRAFCRSRRDEKPLGLRLGLPDEAASFEGCRPTCTRGRVSTRTHTQEILSTLAIRLSPTRICATRLWALSPTHTINLAQILPLESPQPHHHSHHNHPIIATINRHHYHRSGTCRIDVKSLSAKRARSQPVALENNLRCNQPSSILVTKEKYKKYKKCERRNKIHNRQKNKRVAAEQRKHRDVDLAAIETIG